MFRRFIIDAENDWSHDLPTDYPKDYPISTGYPSQSTLCFFPTQNGGINLLTIENCLQKGLELLVGLSLAEGVPGQQQKTSRVLKIPNVVSTHLYQTGCNQWSFLVPLMGARWHIIPQLAIYSTYILP